MPRRKNKDIGPPPPALIGGSVVEPAKSVSENTGNTISQPTHRPEGGFAPGHPYRWQPGQSGNPNGRPKSTTEMKQRAASLTDLALDVIEMSVQLTRRRMEKALEILGSKNATVEELEFAKGVLDKEGLAAAQQLLDRGHGKPQQKVDIDLSSIFDEMSEEEVADYLVNAGQRVTADLLARRKARK